MQTRQPRTLEAGQSGRARSFANQATALHAHQRLSAPVPEVADQIDGIAASLAEVDQRSARRLRDLANSLTSPAGRQRWSDVDLSRAFNTDRLSHSYALRREGGYAPNSIEIADKTRNVLVLVPILLTWAALGEAAAAYRRYIDNNPDQSDQPFLLLWQRGFGGESRWWSPDFSTVALIDAVVIIAIILLTFYAHGRREKQEDNIADTAAGFQAEFDNALAEATVLLATDRSSRPAQLADNVERLAESFESGSQNLLTQLQIEHDRLEHAASRREKEIADFGVFASGMRSGAEEMHRLLIDLRDVSSGLERALEDLASEVTATSNQHRSLLTAVSNLEKLTSTSIQSDQAATRQLSSASARLAETAEKAIAGAESAAQAGRIAGDAVAGISALARDVAASQSAIRDTLSGHQNANASLATALESNSSGVQSVARTLADIGNGLNQLRDDLERIGSQNNQHVVAMTELLNQQSAVSRELSGLVREMGNASMAGNQRQREVTQDFQHLVQRLDGLANTLNRVAQQAPGTDALQQAFTTALRNELGRGTGDHESLASRWGRGRS